jgi:hypothetical protein
MTREWAVVHEAPADFRLATELADRVLVDAIEWLDETILDTQRGWLDQDRGGFPLKWTSIAERAREIGIRARGHFNNEPGLPDASAARRAILHILNQFETVDAIALIRDADDQPERRDGLEQARAQFPDHRIVIGFAVIERECWVLSGFEPEDDAERDRLSDEIQNLGFDPRARSQELNAPKNDQARRSPKRILAALTRGGRERKSRCWRTTDFALLRARGGENGLAACLEEVRTRLVESINE